MTAVASHSFSGSARRAKLLLLAGGSALLCLAHPALAQTAPQAAEAEPEADIIVTGSLVQRNGFDTPTPVTVIGAETLSRVAAPNIADVINQMPSVRPSLTPTSTVNLGSLAAGNYIDLRGLGYQRTQVQVDGRRYVPTTPAGGVSISSIPQAMVNGIDIVTGGASAAYGSDAVAGVVNLRIDSRFKGFKGSVQGGISNYGDYENFLASASYGTSFMDDRLHLVVAAEASQNGGIRWLRDRPWSAKNPGTVSNPAYTVANGEPRLILTDNIRQTNVSYGGVITGVSFTPGNGSAITNILALPSYLKGIQFDTSGNAVPFAFGSLVTASTQVGGDGANGIADSLGAVPVNRYTGFGRLTFDASDAITLFGEFSYNKVTSEYLGLASAHQMSIRSDNVFLPAALRQTLAANNVATITVGRSVLDNARTVSNLDIETINALGGFNAKLGAGWTLDGSFSYGRTKNRATTSNNRITARYNLAVDAIDDPRTPGVVDPICRSTLTDPTNGCVPLNLIGENRYSDAALAYVNGTGFRLWDIKQKSAIMTLRGSPFDTWAGPVSIAAGGEYRELSVKTTSDPISTAQAFFGGGTIPYAGKVTVKEGFGEVMVPLAKDTSWAKDLSVDAAVRVTDYSTSGTVVTWKGGISYAINDSIRVRATRSRDIRAPGLEELFQAGSTSALSVFDPIVNDTYLVTAANQGNPNLTPEKADTFTAGLVLTPTFIPRLKLSVDYYKIELNNAIIALTPAAIVDRCYSGTSPQACPLIIRGGTDDRITRVLNGPVNLTSVKTSGIDVEAQYWFPIGEDRINLQALVTYIDNTSIFDGITLTQLGGSVEQPTVAAVGGNPHWKVNTHVSYVNPGFTLSVAARYIGGGAINRAYTTKDLDVLSVNGRVYFDLQGEVTLIENDDNRVALFGSIQNVFNKTPPITGVGGYGTTRALYDTLGRMFTAGVRFKF
ncbi:TonB-dependent receptor domain-containing protein [Sphingomonas colocasiae]|uniref:TonB-dependent receptor n=1 Tax=Sphingomonas colocasiae TaxID=1848973 RepID=A0ABS7PXK3_9SPHN|nr:TonB-dependent receptor [Sphingomonas colocasiae]MBY8825694.1 TonB-dependent receptor [Sphingomonas colocasiae]